VAGNDPDGFGRTQQLRNRGNCHVEQRLLHFGVIEIQAAQI
jgi:hypothetical protein